MRFTSNYLLGRQSHQYMWLIITLDLRTLVHLKNSPTGVNINLFSDNVGNNKLHNIEYTDSVRNIQL